MVERLAQMLDRAQKLQGPRPNRAWSSAGFRFSFGSYAYGAPHAESDVDLLVIMPAYDVVNQEIRICTAFETWPFSLDLMVRTPKQIERGLREDDCDWFLREVMEKGGAPHRAVGPQGGRRHGGRQKPGHPGKTQTRRGVLPLPAIGGLMKRGTGTATNSGCAVV